MQKMGAPDATVSLALVAPDMAPNVGAVLRLGACMGIDVHVVEPCGFPFSPRAWARQAMDYAEHVTVHHHSGWSAFVDQVGARGRLIGLSARANTSLFDMAFRSGDCLLLGAETSGLPDHAVAAAHAMVAVPMRPPARSLNVAQAAAIATAEVLRQLDLLPAAGGG
ncbi:MAG: TrmH family RNA methyltransferase [Pseudomonadota bacterium]